VKVAPTITIPVGGGLRHSAKWAELPKSYQQMVTTVAEHVAGDRIAKYDSRNPPSIKRLVAAGARLRPVALDILGACYKASQELFAEKNAVFKNLYDSTTAFRNDQYAWHQICETTYDTS
jgi:TRAP-type mannitol/chloroaromatic compound transport system substrate-binding protein